MNTEHLIIETALSLFNRKGSYSITTRHISAAMNISPGNLYYHFKNKEEIIRNIYDLMIDELDKAYRWSDEDADIASLLHNTFKATAGIMYRYRFFFLELPMLLERDKLLKKKYFSIKKERQSDFRKIFQLIKKAGFISDPFQEKDFILATENIWTLEEFILQSMYINRIKINEKNVLESNMKIFHIIKPYIKNDFWIKFSKN